MRRSTFILFLICLLISCQSKKSDYSDLLNYQSNARVELPIADGQLINLDDTTEYYFFYLNEINGDKINFWCNGEEIDLNDFSLQYDENLFFCRSQLFIDKDIRVSTIDSFFAILSGYQLNRIFVVVSNTNKKNELRGIQQFIPYREDLLFKFKYDSIIPLIPTIYRPQITLPPPSKWNTYVYKNDSIYLNDSLIDKESFKNDFRKEININKKKIWNIYIESSSTFQTYVDVYDLMYSIVYTERENYSIMNYQTEYNELEDSLMTVVRNRYPIRIRRLSDDEFNNILDVEMIEDILE
ncbi:MAG: hypothetical protein K9H64_09855 [Bacteroidales bacterium]|nr:hypothetical protein [Bacteroidales bacterium]MCF8456134.1 hypothetical protein [Bacteroidales bacterium]